MKTFRLNVGLLARTVAILFVLGVCTHLAHGWQMHRHAGEQVARADAAQREGDSDELGASLGRAFAFDPTDQAVRLRYGLHLASVATTTRTRWRALQVLAGVLARQPGQADAAMKGAELALALGEPGDACKYLAAALAHLPDRVDLLDLYGRAQMANGDAQGAARSLRRALELEPNRVSSASLLAELLRGPLEVPKQADAVMDRLVKDNPQSAQALLARARHRIATIRLEPARADLALACKLNPGDVTLWTTSAQLESLRGDFAAAADHWQAVLKRKPEQVEAYLGLVRAERERGQAEEAIEPLRRGLKHMPDQPDLLFALADLLIGRGETAEGESLRARLPRTGAAGRSLYLSARMEERQKHWRRAATMFTKAAAAGDLRNEDAAQLFLALARCQEKLDAHEEQLVAARQAFQFDPAPSVCLEWAAMLLSRQAGGPHASAAAVPLLRSLAQMPVPPEHVWVLLARALIEYNRIRSPSQSDWTEVEKALAKASETKADAVTAAQLRVHMYLLRGDEEQAGKSINEALQRHPDEALLWKLRVELALRGKAKSVRPLLDEADRRLAGRIQWLIARADLLALYPDNPVLGDLQTLDQSAQRLSNADRDRLERHLAEIAWRMGKYPILDRLCHSLLERHPNDLRARMLLLQVQLAADDDRGAEALIADMRKREGADETTWRSAAVAWLLNKAKRGDRSGLVEARKRVDELRQRRPSAAEVNFLAGRLADLEGKPAEALESYRRVLQQGDYRPVAVRRVVQLLVAEGRYVSADEVLEVVGWYGELDHSLFRPAAEIALRAGRLDRACALAQAVVPPESKSAPDVVWRGRILQAAGRHTEALAAFTDAVRLDPGTPDSWLPLLAHLARQGQTEQSEAALARMQREVSADLLPLATAQALEAMGQADRAERAYRLVLKSTPRDGPALMGLLRLYMRDNRNAYAERVLHLLFDRSVLVPEENLPELRRQMALAITAPQRKTPQWERALALLALNRARDPNDPADQRVELLVRAAIPEDRLTALQALEKFSPDTLPDVEKLRLAQLYDAVNNWPQARTQLLSLLEADGRNAGCMAVLIDGLLRRGKKAEAAGWLERLVKIEPNSARTQELRERMARAERKAGQ